MFYFLAQPKKDNNQIKNQKQPEVPKNRTVRKSDNQGVKEETVTQSGRRVGDGKPGQRGHAARQWRTRQARWQLVDWAVPHSHDDKLEEQLGSKRDCTTQGVSEGK